ncbi:hypothetical protein N7451_008135 [Penicillium sp. IBT 35674x]|nr:hypothetical protein N7451_008135 [Penicillium sp. IBT 35674x]
MKKRYMVGTDTKPMQLTRKDFDNPEVLNARNPHPHWGFTHGPMFDPNVVLKTPVNSDDEDEDEDEIDVKPIIDIECVFGEFMELVESQGAFGVESTAQTKHELVIPRPPRQMLLINPHNSGICDIIVVLPDIMCGFKAKNGSEMHAHLRTAHHGAIVRPMRHNMNHAWNTSVNTLKRWVLTGGWREAKYRMEPIRSGRGSLIDLFCQDLERIAREDASFAAKYGCQFHRYSAHLESMDDVEYGEPGYRYLVPGEDKIYYKDDRFLI